MLSLYWSRDEKWDEEAETLFEKVAGLYTSEHATVEHPETFKAKLQIIHGCTELMAMLFHKNKQYGNSALSNDSDVFGVGLSAADNIRIRINDKLKRLKHGAAKEDEDVILDLTGYLVLLRAATHNEQTLPEAVPENAKELASEAVARMQTDQTIPPGLVRTKAPRVPSTVHDDLVEAIAIHGLANVQRAVEGMRRGLEEGSPAIPARDGETTPSLREGCGKNDCG